ncbi:MAG: acetylglutamate kinase [Chloroflexi bacterium]|nr:acetylglutamate kinase [Chloroflexota bacterium]
MNPGRDLSEVIVIKIGGSTLGSHDTTLDDLVALQKRGQHTVVVHGGANAVSEWLKRLDLPVRFVKGLRVTDAETLKVVVAVLAGLVNKELVAGIEAAGGRAAGLTGIDGALVEAEINNADLGYVGEVRRIDLSLLQSVVGAGFIPVVAPLGLQTPPRTLENGYTLNLNGDTVAGEIAAAISARSLVFLTDVAGVLDKSGQLLTRLSVQEARAMLASGVASGGMIPKLEACLRALSTVPVTRVIDGRVPHALLKEIEGNGNGTTIA